MKELLRKGKALWGEFSVVGAGTHASSIAYFTFLSLVPLLALCISLVSATGIDQQEVAKLFLSLVPKALEDLVKTLVEDAFERSGIAFSLSTVTLLWSASKGIKALRSGLNATFAVQETRTFVVVAGISIVTVVIMGVLVTAVMYLIFGDSFLHTIAKDTLGLQQQTLLASVLNPAVMLVLGALILSACYAYLPAGMRRFRSQLPGAVLATLACGVFSFGFRLYVDHFGNYTVLYGSIATVALLLVWMYLVSYIIIICGFINRLLAEKREAM